jgi:hypothetical protein
MGLIITFLLAMVVFAGVTFLCKRILESHIQNDDLRTVISFICAAAVTLAVLYAVKFINRHRMKDDADL